MSQVLVNTAVTAAVALLIAISFSLVYWVGRFFHFALGGIIVFGAYLSYFSHHELGSSVITSIVLSTVVGGGLGALMEFLVHRPLRARNASAVTMLLASLGIYIVLINSVSLFWGDQVRLLFAGTLSISTEVGGAYFSTARFIILFSAVAVAIASWLTLRFTMPGKVFRAVASNPEVARMFGIAENPVHLGAIFVSSVLGAYVGVLSASDTELRPDMGFPLLILGVTTALIGQDGGVVGLGIAAFMVATCQIISIWFFGMQWRDATTLLLLIVILLVRYRRGSVKAVTLRERT